MISTILICLIIITAIVYASMFEWTLHRFVMHRPVGEFDYPFKAHIRHHRIFKADRTYHLMKEEEKSHIAMDWWNGPVLIIVGTLPPAVLSYFTNMWSIYIVFFIMAAIYYSAYEYLHWCMHSPRVKRRMIEQLWVFRILNGHHLLHHRYNGFNFNVVLPLADLLFHTLLTRSPVCFAQARGPSLPDVQPIKS